MYSVNIDGTENVVNIALESGVRRLLHVSSIAALGRTTKATTVTEEKKWEENKKQYALRYYQAPGRNACVAWLCRRTGRCDHQPQHDTGLWQLAPKQLRHF